MKYFNPFGLSEPLSYWQRLEEQERQKELQRQQQALQFTYQPQPPWLRETGYGDSYRRPSPPQSAPAVRPAQPRIPTNIHDLPDSLADLPDMTEEQVRGLDKDVYNELFGSALPSLVPAWIKIEKMERRKKEAKRLATSSRAELNGYVTNRIPGLLFAANSNGKSGDEDPRWRFEDLSDNQIQVILQFAYRTGAVGQPCSDFWEHFDKTYIRESFPDAYLKAFQGQCDEGRDDYLRKNSEPA